jgi:hypothetical protein
MTPSQQEIVNKYKSHFSLNKDLDITILDSPCASHPIPKVVLASKHMQIDIAIEDATHIYVSCFYKSTKFGSVNYCSWSQSIMNTADRIKHVLTSDEPKKFVELIEKIVGKFDDAGFKIKGKWQKFSATKGHLKALIDGLRVVLYTKNEHGNFIQSGRKYFYINASEEKLVDGFKEIDEFINNKPVERLTLNKLPEPRSFSDKIFVFGFELELGNTIMSVDVCKIVTLDNRCYVDDSVDIPSQDPWFLVRCNVRRMYNNIIHIIYRDSRYHLLSGNSRFKVTTEHPSDFNELDRMLLERATYNFSQNILGKEPNWDKIKRTKKNGQ